MLLISDLPTLYLEKVANKNNIFFKNILIFPNQIDDNSIAKANDILLIVGDCFYKLLDINLDFEENFNSQNPVFLKLESIISTAYKNGINVYMPLIPKHFLYKNYNEKFYSRNCSDLKINSINSYLFNKFSKYENLYFLRGLIEVKPDLSKDFFRFESIFNIANSETIISQLLARMKFSRTQFKKLIILDLDNTLWKGIVGEDDIVGIRMDRSDPIGAIFNRVQNIFLDLKKRGFLLAICSKNNEEIALKALFENPSSQIKKEDIITYRINWKPKSENILDICNELNLSPRDTVFVDDSEFEVKEVKTNVEGISIFKVPKNIYNYPSDLLSNSLFISDDVTEEDKYRTSLYKNRIIRDNLLKKTFLEKGSNDDWMKSLNMKLNIKKITHNGSELNRVIQLFNRTNQFNLSGKKYNKNIFQGILESKEKSYYSGTVIDNIGSEGIISVIGFIQKKDIILVEDFILSCRVFGRYIDISMLKPILEIALEKDCSINFVYNDTGRNKVVKEFIYKSIIKKAFIPNKNLGKLISKINSNPIEIISN